MAESCGNNQGCSHGGCVGSHRDNLVRAALEKPHHGSRDGGSIADGWRLFRSLALIPWRSLRAYTIFVYGTVDFEARQDSLISPELSMPELLCSILDRSHCGFINPPCPDNGH